MRQRFRPDSNRERMRSKARRLAAGTKLPRSLTTSEGHAHGTTGGVARHGVGRAKWAYSKAATRLRIAGAAHGTGALSGCAPYGTTQTITLSG